MPAYLNLRRTGLLGLTLVFLTALSGLELRGQTILSGTYSGGPGSIGGDVSINPSGTATFTSGTTFTGANATLGNYSTFNWNQNATLAGKTVTFGSASNYAYLVVGAGNTLTLDSATTLTGDLYLYNGNNGGTILNQGTINQTSGTGYIYAPTFTNSGALTVSGGAGLTLGYYATDATTNAAGGTITATGTGSNIYLTNIVNLGTLSALLNGTLNFSGTTNTTANLGSVSLASGGRAMLSGTLNNTSATLNAPTGGSFQLFGGTLNNGTIATGALTFTGSGGTLSNVSFTGDLTLPASAAVTFTNGTGFTGANATLGNYSTLNWNQNGTLAGKTFTFGSAGNYAYLNLGTNNSLTLDSATTFNGDIYLYNGNNGGTILNQGSINQTSGTGYIYAPTLTNSGAITGSGGSSLYLGYYATDATTNAAGGTITATGTGSNIYLTNIVNLGTLYAQLSGVLNFLGTSNTPANLGNVSLSGGGRALLSGTFNNTSTTINAPSGGAFELFGGTINNGTIAAGALSFTGSGGTLSNASYTGGLTLPASTSVTFTNGTLFTGATATLGNYSTLNWNQNGTLVGKTFTFGTGANYAYINVGTNNSLTLDSATTLNGDIYLYNGNNGGTILNQGAINQNAGTGYLYAPTFTNSGTITANAGTSLYVGYYDTDLVTNAAGGTITATGASTYVYLTNIVNLGTLYAQLNGVLNFQGTSNTPANLGSVSLSGGGRALLSGTFNNTSTTINAPSGGVYELYGGTINNGTIAAGALSFTGSGGSLSNVSYTGDLTLPASTTVTFKNGTLFTGSNATLGNYSTLNWNQNGTLAGKTFTFGTGANYAYINVGANNSLTLGSATTLNGDIYVSNGNNGGTILNQGTINHTAGTGYVYAPTFTNSGAITASGASSLYLGYYGTDSTTNAVGGTITATGASTYVYLTNIVNLGTLYAQLNGVLIFQGASNTPANLGSVSLASGGRAWLNGTFNNTSTTINAPSGGVYELYGGTINNGTVAAGALTFTGSGGTLSNVSYTGDLTLPASTSVTFTNGTLFTGANANLGNYSSLTWNQNGTLAGKSLTFGSAGNYAYLNVGTGQTLTLDSATTLSGDIYVYNSNSGGTILNQGVINHNSGTGYLYAPIFTNSGSITANSGTSLYVGYYGTDVTTNAAGGTITATGTGANAYLQNIHNLGTISAQLNGALYFQGSANTTAQLGNVTLASGGRALLYGTLDNTSATLNAPTGGLYELYAGTINNGTIASGALSFTGSGGTLSNVIYNGDFTLPAGAAVTFSNGTSFTGANGTLGNYSTYYWYQNGTLAGKTITSGSAGNYSNLAIGTNNTLTLDSATTLNGTLYLSGNSGATLINQGTINQTSGTGYLYVPTFTNAGILNSQSGFLYISGALTNTAGGTVTGPGGFSGNITFAGGTLAPGLTLGNLTFANGSFAVTGPTALNVDLGGAVSDQVIFQNPTGAVNLGASLLTLNLNLVSAPTLNTTFDLLHISSGGAGFSGTFVGLPLTGDTIVASYAATPYTFYINYLPNDITLVYGVPEPSTWALLGAGLSLLAFRRRRGRHG